MKKTCLARFEDEIQIKKLGEKETQIRDSQVAVDDQDRHQRKVKVPQ